MTTMTPMTTMTLDLKPNPELCSQTTKLVALAEFYTITNPEESVEASEFLARIQHLRRWIDGIYKDAKGPLATAKRTLDAQQKALLDPLAVAERTVMQRIVDYTRLQEQQRQRDALLVAERLAQADMIEHAPPLVMPVAVIMESVLAKGVQQRTNYAAKVENFRDLVLGIAAQIIVTEYEISAEMRVFLTEKFMPTQQCSLSMVEASIPTLNALARSLRNDLNIPGVTLEEKITLIAK